MICNSDVKETIYACAAIDEIVSVASKNQASKDRTGRVSSPVPPMKSRRSSVHSPPNNVSFGGSLRDALLNEEWLDSLDDARRKLAL